MSEKEPIAEIEIEEELPEEPIIDYKECGTDIDDDFFEPDFIKEETEREHDSDVIYCYDK